MSRAGTTLALAWLVACSGASEPTRPLHIEVTPSGADTRLTLVAAPELKVSARLKPALELPDRSVLRLDSPALTPDSAYFAEPPSAVVAGRHARVHGTLRASVCDPGKTVCRTVVLDL